MRKRGIIPSWSSLTEDPALSDDVRSSLRSFKGASGRTPPEEILSSLDTYRRVRELNDLSRHISQSLSDETVEADSLIEQVNERVAKLGSSAGDLRINHIGKNANTLALVKSLMNGDNRRFIPTGFRTYDSVNYGLALGSFFMVAAPSGDGKSAVVQALAENLAMSGGKVLMVPLEMDNAGILQRSLAKITGITLNKFLSPKEGLSQKQRRNTLKAYKAFSRKMKRRGGQFTLLTSETELSIEGVLAYAKSCRYKVVIIDYVGLLSGMDGDDQVRALGRAGRAAKLWASANNAVVIMAAQLNDEGKVKYSRALTEHASNLWIWARNNFSRETSTIQIHQPKSRQQDNFSFTLHFNPATMTVRDLTEKEQKAMGNGGGKSPPPGSGSDNERRSKGRKETSRAQDYFDDL